MTSRNNLLNSDASFLLILKLHDTIPPNISTIDDISLEARSSTQNLVTLDIPEISDEVGVMSITNDAPEVYPLGETIVTWTATDFSGNSASATQTITVVDTTAPVVENLDLLKFENFLANSARDKAFVV